MRGRGSSWWWWRGLWWSRETGELGIIKGGDGGGGEREGKGRQKPNRSNVDVEERSIAGVLQYCVCNFLVQGGG